MFTAILKSIGAPGSPGFFAAAAVIALLLMRSRRTRRIGGWTLAGLVALYGGLSLPVVARAIEAGVTAQASPPAEAPEALSDLFVFDGENHRERAAFAAEVFRARQPRTVWVLGGDALRDALLAHGVPRDRWRWGGVPDPTTRGQVLQLSELMSRTGISRAVIVVSRIHVPRVTALAARLGLDAVVLAPPDHRGSLAGEWRPSAAALGRSRDAIYEWAALAWYGWRGWI